MAPYSWYPVESGLDDTDKDSSTYPKKDKKVSNRRNKSRVDANRGTRGNIMEEELEVVKISPSAALDRALQKDRTTNKGKISEVYEKKMYDDDGNVEDSNDDIDSEEEEEEVGQELLWREDATVKPTKNRKFRFKLPKLTKKQPVDPTTVSLSEKVWVIPTSNIPHEYQERVANKSQEARQYLEQALSSSAVSTPVERDANCRKAFFHAAEARRLVDPTSVNKELEDMRLQGEYEAREASRILALALTSSPLSSDQHMQETEAMNEQSDAILPSKHTASNFTITPISEMMRLANAHAEAARHYLESILPKFQETKHDDTNSFNSGQDDLDVPENKSEDINEEVRENGKPAIVMIENSTISSLGFDNTFRNDLSIMNLNSLNAILDGPMSETGNSDNTISPVSNLDIEDNENRNADPVVDMSRPVGWFRHISQRRHSAQFRNRSQSQIVQDDLHRVQSVERRTGELLQRAWKESPDARLGVSPLQPSAPAFVTAPVFAPGILSVKSWESLADGMPLEEVVPPPEKESESNEVSEIERQVKKPKLQFWKSKKFNFNSKRKQDVSKSDLYGKDSAVPSEGIKEDEREANPIASADTNATDMVTPNVSSGGADDSVLRSGSSMEADRYTAMYDVEDGVHLAAAKRLASTGTNLPPTETVVEKIRNVFSWGGGGDVGKRQNSLGVQPDFVEVHKEGEIGEDSTNVVLANSETVANAIQSSVPIEQPPEVKTSQSYDPNATRSDSIQDQIEERKKEILEMNTVKENKNLNLREKRRFFKRLTVRRAEV